MTDPIPRPTSEVRPFWLQGSDASTGDRYYHRPGVLTHLCLAADRAVTWVFYPPLPGSMGEAMERVADVRAG